MRNLKAILSALIFSLGCSSGESAKPTASEKPTSTEAPQGSSIFAKKTIKAAGKEILVEIADTDPKRSQGLMYRTHMNENEGMLFIFEEERPLSFWMRNTRIPLSIAYIDAKKKIINILEMVPAPDSDFNPPVYPSSAPAKYALEMNKGWFTQNKIKPGQTIEIK